MNTKFNPVAKLTTVNSELGSKTKIGSISGNVFNNSIQIISPANIWTISIENGDVYLYGDIDERYILFRYSDADWTLNFVGLTVSPMNKTVIVFKTWTTVKNISPMLLSFVDTAGKITTNVPLSADAGNSYFGRLYNCTEDWVDVLFKIPEEFNLERYAAILIINRVKFEKINIDKFVNHTIKIRFTRNDSFYITVQNEDRIRGLNTPSIQISLALVEKAELVNFDEKKTFWVNLAPLDSRYNGISSDIRIFFPPKIIVPTPTPSSSKPSTPTPTPTVSPTRTPAPSVTPTQTPTPNVTQTPTPTISPTHTPTPTISLSETKKVVFNYVNPTPTPSRSVPSTLVGRIKSIIRMKVPSAQNKVAPMIDTQRLSFTLVHNIINTMANPNSELEASGGEALCKYILKPVVLNPDMQASKFFIAFAANIPPECFIRVYYRTLNTLEDSEKDIRKKKWRYVGDSGLIHTTTNEWRDFEYTINSIDYDDDSSVINFDSFSIKLVLESTSNAVVPLVKDFRTLALS